MPRGPGALAAEESRRAPGGQALSAGWEPWNRQGPEDSTRAGRAGRSPSARALQLPEHLRWPGSRGRGTWGLGSSPLCNLGHVPIPPCASVSSSVAWG